MEGRHLQGDRKISSEAGMHLFVLPHALRRASCSSRPSRHRHGFAVAGQGLDQALLPEVVVSLGKIPLAAMPLPALRISALSLSLTSRTTMLCCWPITVRYLRPALPTAFFRIELSSILQRSLSRSWSAGEPQLLSTREVAKLMAARARYFVNPPPGGGWNLPLKNLRQPCNHHLTKSLFTRSELDALVDEAVRRSRSPLTLLRIFSSLPCPLFFLSHLILAGKARQHESTH